MTLTRRQERQLGAAVLGAASVLAAMVSGGILAEHVLSGDWQPDFDNCGLALFCRPRRMVPFLWVYVFAVTLPLACAAIGAFVRLLNGEKN